MMVKYLQIRNQSPDLFFKKGMPENFAEFTGKHLCQSLFLNKVPSLRPAILLQKRLAEVCQICEISKKSFFYRRNPFSSGCFWNLNHLVK